MAKSQEQKTREIIARRRRFFSAHRAVYLRTQPGGDIYLANIRSHTKEYADRKAQESTIAYIKTASDAHMNLDGTPI